MFVVLAAAFVVDASGPDSWQGVRPGEAMTDVIAAIGQPLLQRQMPDGEILTWHSLPNPDAYMIILAGSGFVHSIRVFQTRPDGSKTGLTDPFGVTIGDSPAQLESRRGKPFRTYSDEPGRSGYSYHTTQGNAWLYEFDGDALHAIMLIGSPPGPAPKPTGPDPRDGSSISNAFVITARTEEEGVHFERFYASIFSGCASGWRLEKQSLLSQSGHQYDKLDMSCQADGSKHAFYFDITSFFGKL